MKNVSKFEKQIDIKFKNSDLLTQAIVHRSYINEHPDFKLGHNERLEFLGDAVLGLIVTDELYRRFEDKSEGELTKAKSYFVSREMLAKHAKKIELGQYLFLGTGEEKAGGRFKLLLFADLRISPPLFHVGHGECIGYLKKYSEPTKERMMSV